MNSVSVVSQRRSQLLSMLLVFLGLGLWLGSLMFFGFGVAGVIFQNLPSKDLAGMINGIILGRLNILELCSAALIIVGLALYNVKLRHFWAKIPLLIVIVMTVLTFVYGFVMTSSMNDIKKRVHSFDTPVDLDRELIAEFRGYHTLYSRLVGINLGLGVVLFVWQTVLYVSPEGLGGLFPLQPKKDSAE